MKDAIIKFETAVLAKEKGFDVQSDHWFQYRPYNNSYVLFDSSDNLLSPRFDEGDLWCPTQSLLQRWLREVHFIDVVIYPSFMGSEMNYYYLVFSKRDFDNIIQGETNNYTYEEAFEAGLQKALKLIDNGKK